MPGLPSPHPRAAAAGKGRSNRLQTRNRPHVGHVRDGQGREMIAPVEREPSRLAAALTREGGWKFAGVFCSLCALRTGTVPRSKAALNEYPHDKATEIDLHFC